MLRDGIPMHGNTSTSRANASLVPKAFTMVYCRVTERERDADVGAGWEDGLLGLRAPCHSRSLLLLIVSICLPRNARMWDLSPPS